MFNKNYDLLSLIIFLSPAAAVAGSLNPPGGPTHPASAMYNIQDICNRLDSGAAASKQTFTQPTSDPADLSYCTLNDIMNKSPVVNDAHGAIPAEVLAGKTFWGLTSGHWGPQTGTLTVQTPDNTTVNQPAGRYDAFNLSTVDTDLVSGNIKSGITLFGVTGDSNVVDTSSGDAVASDIANGKKAWVDGVEITGTHTQGGWTCSGTLNGTRWCDNGDGTVRDMTTGLIWLQKADWGGAKEWDGNSNDNAHVRAGILEAGATNANLSDGSNVGDWRLPTKSELVGITTGTEPVSSGDMRAFSGVQTYDYWSSTSDAGNASFAWHVDLYYGNVSNNYGKTVMGYVWPVRGGE